MRPNNSQIPLGAVLAGLLLLLAIVFLAFGLVQLLGGSTDNADDSLSAIAAETAVTITPTPFPTASAIMGQSRTTPIPYSLPVTLLNWELQVLEVKRGDEALQAVLAANSYNDPPPEGHQYLLVRMRVRNTSINRETSDLGVHVIGDRFVTHYSFHADAVPPEPWVETTLAGGQESVGWEVYKIYEGEENLLLKIDELFNFNEPVHYAALSEGAAQTIPITALSAIVPTDVGIDAREPAPFGDTVTTEDWQVTVLELLKGQKAWALIRETNQFNDPPAPGQQYIAAKLRLRYIGAAEGQNADGHYFNIIDSDGASYPPPSVVEPEPPLDFEFYPGGEAEGWVVLQAPAFAADLVLRFKPPQDPENVNERYLSLVDTGR